MPLTIREFAIRFEQHEDTVRDWVRLKKVRWVKKARPDFDGGGYVYLIPDDERPPPLTITENGKVFGRPRANPAHARAPTAAMPPLPRRTVTGKIEKGTKPKAPKVHVVDRPEHGELRASKPAVQQAANVKRWPEPKEGPRPTRPRHPMAGTLDE